MMKEKQLKFFNVYLPEEEEQPKKRRIVKIPLDTLVLIIIINILSLIVAFSLGINTGKKQISSQKKYFALDSNITIAKETPNKSEVNISRRKNTPEDLVKNNSSQSAHKKRKERTPKKELEKGYIIQVASYLKETIARKETEQLRKSGFSAFLTKKGKYLVIYVGSFPTKKEAEKTKLMLKKRFNDCFIKKI